MTETPRHACRVCPRTDLSLTANGRIRSHAANGKRPGLDNPNCPGGSDFPREPEPAPAPVTASGGPNPYRAPLPDHVHRFEYGDDGHGHSGSVCTVCGEPEPDLPPAHVHRFEDADHENGHLNAFCAVCGEPEKTVREQAVKAIAVSMDLPPELLTGPNPAGSPVHVHRFEYRPDGPTRGAFFCAVCGAPEELPPGWTGPSPLMNQRFMEYLNNRTPEQKLDTALSMDRTASAVLGLPLDPDLPHDRHTDPQTEDPWQTIPGSTPPSNPSATDAAARSTKATSSARTETVGKRDRTAAVTTETAAPADEFESATAPVQRAEQRVERDGYGRYRLIHPVTGKKQSWQRVTTFAKMLEDTFGLGKWQRRMAAKGLTLRPDLLDVIATLDVKRDSTQMDLLLEQAMDAAGQKVAANQGTVCHKHTENVDRGDPLEDVPAKYLKDVTAYTEAIRKAGITIIPFLIERITAVPDLGVGGTFDRVILDRHGKYRILDVKTGNMDFGQLGICVQLATYAAGVNTAGVYDLDTGTWLPPQSYGDSVETGPWSVPKVETDYALVAHIPVGSGTCELLKVPIDTGWEAVQTAVQVRDWRKQKRLFSAYDPGEDDGPSDASGWSTPYDGHNPIAVQPPTWPERFRAVGSRAEAMALYTEALSALGTGPELDSLVQIGMAVLSGTADRLTSGS